MVKTASSPQVLKTGSKITLVMFICNTFGKDVSKLKSCIYFYNYNKKMLLKGLPIISDRTAEVRYEYLCNTPRGAQKVLRVYRALLVQRAGKDVPEARQLENNSKWQPSRKKRDRSSKTPSRRPTRWQASYRNASRHSLQRLWNQRNIPTLHSCTVRLHSRQCAFSSSILKPVPAPEKTTRFW